MKQFWFKGSRDIDKKYSIKLLKNFGNFKIGTFVNAF